MSEEPNKAKPQLFCCVATCRNYNNPYSATELYQFPVDLVQRRKFSEILAIPNSVAEQDTARVCALHFKSKTQVFNNPSPAIQPFCRVSIILFWVKS